MRMSSSRSSMVPRLKRSELQTHNTTWLICVTDEAPRSLANPSLNPSPKHRRGTSSSLRGVGRAFVCHRRNAAFAYCQTRRVTPLHCDREGPGVGLVLPPRSFANPSLYPSPKHRRGTLSSLRGVGRAFVRHRRNAAFAYCQTRRVTPLHCDGEGPGVGLVCGVAEEGFWWGQGHPIANPRKSD